MTPSPSVTIRPATKDDLPALVDLWWENSVLAESHSPTPYLRGEQECRAACHENYERSLTWANYLYVVAEYRREVVGFIIACLQAAPQKSRSGRRVVLECVFVKEPYRRRGICRQMFEQVQTFARRNQASSIEVSTECRISEEQWYREVAAVITPAYLAADNPRSQSGSNSDDASWQLNRGLIADAIHKDGTFTPNVATK